jgi:polysaccharide export outer membrane protein
MSGGKSALLVVAAVLFAVSGCARPELHGRLTSLDIVQKHEPDEPYTVDPPDRIQVAFLHQPELTRQVTIRSDGCVTLPLLDDVQVAGLTAAEVREKVEQEYRRYFLEPEIMVTVTGFRSKHIYLYGEVGRQGKLPYTGHQTVADALGAAGGVTRRAATGRVRVIRGDPEDPEIFRVDLDDLLYKGDTRQDVSLAENDIVYVPPTWLAWVGYQIESLLFPTRGVTQLAVAPAGLSPE